MRNVIESGDEKTDRTLNSEEEKIEKRFNFWENFGYFGTESCDFSIEKANLPENTYFISIMAINLLKTLKKFIIPTFSY